MTCEDYFENPELNAAHLERCAECRALEEALHEETAGDLGDAGFEPRPISVDALPLATWEGASHRTWPLVAAGALSVLSLAIVLFLAAGTPPLRGIAQAVTSSVPGFEAASKFFAHFGSGIHGAPMHYHVIIGVLFVVINSLLFLLLRRPPKGIDV
jgi:hypothetical protein